MRLLWDEEKKIHYLEKVIVLEPNDFSSGYLGKLDIDGRPIEMADDVELLQSNHSMVKGVPVVEEDTQRAPATSKLTGELMYGAAFLVNDTDDKCIKANRLELLSRPDRADLVVRFYCTGKIHERSADNKIKKFEITKVIAEMVPEFRSHVPGLTGTFYSRTARK